MTEQIVSQLEQERNTLREMKAKLEAGEYTTRSGKFMGRRLLEGAIRSTEREIKELERRAKLA